MITQHNILFSIFALTKAFRVIFQLKSLLAEATTKNEMIENNFQKKKKMRFHIAIAAIQSDYERNMKTNKN